jgi:precorrin-6Y C5,15-methyltransferase (decarboxylating)
VGRVSDRDRVVVVGIGDDGPAGLTSRALEAVRGAELLYGGRRHLDFFPEHPAECVAVTGDIRQVVGRIRHELGKRRVVVLASGDPGYYGIGPILARELGRERVETIPGVSAAALAFARLGESWQDAVVLSAHGRPLEPVLRRARAVTKLAVLTDETNTPAAVARALLGRGLEDCWAWVFEHLGGANERCVQGRLSEIAEQRFADLNILVLLRDSARPPDAPFGRPESGFVHRNGMITKAEVRAVSLSKLRLRRDGVLWDVGAGCGSLAIEAAGLMPEGIVYAVERSAEQIALIEQNLASHGAGAHVTLVHGEAPDALDPLPDPDAVFLGGSGGSLEEIMEAAYDRLPAGGRLVANLATVEHLAICTRWASNREAEIEVVQVSISRGAAVQGLTRLAAQNPVFVVSVGKRL